jgi:hypothetical protein
MNVMEEKIFVILPSLIPDAISMLILHFKIFPINQS